MKLFSNDTTHNHFSKQSLHSIILLERFHHQKYQIHFALVLSVKLQYREKKKEIHLLF